MILDEAFRRCGTNEFGAGSARTLRPSCIYRPAGSILRPASLLFKLWGRRRVTHLAVEHVAVAGAAMDGRCGIDSLTAAPQSFSR
jgi:hypothetical protein